ncbi:cytochrome C oxidase subunit IV family protein [Mycobacterium sp. SMC-4]|uniref:cytochrome C oxidase subunit IV family protein n=1 Tax=Mycobacterium sp. SMC-4 TaxID=2857059 RepID=UPI0021B3543C|nr:cytochrome C oxidase subunit IV family protein [Mycobacterium sp. SMC-4]UXA17249.1 cytochrome C oxidase subunit IV family protein [Mycobacterium sp. SMC-4]
MTALRLIGPRALSTWVLLVAATVVSWAVGADHGAGSAAVVIVLAIAAIKVRLVGLDFMELRHAPLPLRAAFEGYCVALWAVLSALYLWL